MKIINLKNGLVLLKAPNGVQDKRTNLVHSEAIVEEREKRYFIPYHIAKEPNK